MEENKIEIPLSKVKIFLLFTGSIIFVILGILFTLNPEEWLTSTYRSPKMIKLIGIVSTMFFGILSIFIGLKLFDNKIGLTIDENGITDNTNATSIGLIEWRDIIGMEKTEIESTKIIILRINNKQKYINKARNRLAKHAMKANDKMYGSPISIISNSLKIKFKDLEDLLKSELEKRGKNRMKFF